ncbi:MAG: response regulator transcription factor, partial [Chitinophagaceae bacterium]
MEQGIIKVSVVDDHVLLREGLVGMINSFPDYSVISRADNGRQFVTQLESGLQPDIVLLDINMPVMDGFDTSRWVQERLPEVKILALSMYDNESSVIRMIRNGAR